MADAAHAPARRSSRRVASRQRRDDEDEQEDVNILASAPAARAGVKRSREDAVTATGAAADVEDAPPVRRSTRHRSVRGTRGDDDDDGDDEHALPAAGGAAEAGARDAVPATRASRGSRRSASATAAAVVPAPAPAPAIAAVVRNGVVIVTAEEAAARRARRVAIIPGRPPGRPRKTPLPASAAAASAADATGGTREGVGTETDQQQPAGPRRPAVVEDDFEGESDEEDASMDSDDDDYTQRLSRKGRAALAARRERAARRASRATTPKHDDSEGEEAHPAAAGVKRRRSPGGRARGEQEEEEEEEDTQPAPAARKSSSAQGGRKGKGAKRTRHTAPLPSQAMDMIIEYTRDAHALLLFSQTCTAYRHAVENLPVAHVLLMPGCERLTSPLGDDNLRALRVVASGYKCEICREGNVKGVKEPWGVWAHDACVRSQLVNSYYFTANDETRRAELGNAYRSSQKLSERDLRAAGVPFETVNGYNPHAPRGKRDWVAYYYWKNKSPLMRDTCTVQGFLEHNWGKGDAKRAAAYEDHKAEVKEAARNARHVMQAVTAERERIAAVVTARKELERDRAVTLRTEKLAAKLAKEELPSIAQLKQQWTAAEFDDVIGDYFRPRITAPFTLSVAVFRVREHQAKHLALAARKQRVDELLVEAGLPIWNSLLREFVSHSAALQETVKDVFRLVETPSMTADSAATAIVSYVANVRAARAAQQARCAALNAALSIELGTETTYNKLAAKLPYTLPYAVGDFLSEVVTPQTSETAAALARKLAVIVRGEEAKVATTSRRQSLDMALYSLAGISTYNTRSIKYPDLAGKISTMLGDCLQEKSVPDTTVEAVLAAVKAYVDECSAAVAARTSALNAILAASSMNVVNLDAVVREVGGRPAYVEPLLQLRVECSVPVQDVAQKLLTDVLACRQRQAQQKRMAALDAALHPMPVAAITTRYPEFVHHRSVLMGDYELMRETVLTDLAAVQTRIYDWRKARDDALASRIALAASSLHITPDALLALAVKYAAAFGDALTLKLAPVTPVETAVRAAMCIINITALNQKLSGLNMHTLPLTEAAALTVCPATMPSWRPCIQAVFERAATSMLDDDALTEQLRSLCQWVVDNGDDGTAVSAVSVHYASHESGAVQCATCFRTFGSAHACAQHSQALGHVGAVQKLNFYNLKTRAAAALASLQPAALTSQEPADRPAVGSACDQPVVAHVVAT